LHYMLPDDLSAHIRSADPSAHAIRLQYQSTRPGGTLPTMSQLSQALSALFGVLVNNY